MQVCLFGLQVYRSSFYRDLLRNRSDLQPSVCVRNDVGGYRQICLRQRLEPAGCHFKIAVPRRHVCNRVMAAFIRIRLPLNAGGLINERYVCFRHTRPALVRHRTAHRSKQNLGVGALNESQQGEPEDKHGKKKTTKSISKHHLYLLALHAPLASRQMAHTMGGRVGSKAALSAGKHRKLLDKLGGTLPMEETACQADYFTFQN